MVYYGMRGPNKKLERNHSSLDILPFLVMKVVSAGVNM
jgi:hypothetical protein